ncbi:hypothetical protein Q3O59_02885 [Alkalimonas delamerensis]|uniref:Uncharacterized protein n=1 Tax=Alkalimonas delamerensis TaxID=265981 RepID=A0ABT9GLY0_9GAMM|nr:hypothetical protein [Alkalimonas delamerensis]MDP4527976.1 hypothetical protein [Alkalimonas delamerensis]
MTTTLVIGFPVLAILFIVIPLKLKASFSFLLIFALGIASPFAVDFVYCSVLGKECKPDALEAVGFLFLAISVIIISSAIYAFVPKKFKQRSIDGG